MTVNTKCLQILITAGPTREPIDKVRFISNLSTGKMGYEIARQALKRRHRVILISGPVDIISPKGVKFISVITAVQMRNKVGQYFKHCDCLIMAAAVSDFRPKRIVKKKIKKTDFQRPCLELEENPDILLETGRRKEGKVLVGFALETENLIKNARAKLETKNLDLIVANQLTPENSPFGDKKVKVVLINREGSAERLGLRTKKQIAERVLERVEKIA